MADVSKTNGIPVVSNNHHHNNNNNSNNHSNPSSPPPAAAAAAAPLSACKQQLTSTSTSNRDSPNTTSTGSDADSSLVDLSFGNMADDATSLQDLIDSELALRISTETIEDEPDSPPPCPVVPEITKVELLDLKVVDDDEEEEPSSSERFDGDGRQEAVDLGATIETDVEIAEVVDSPPVEAASSPDGADEKRLALDLVGGFPPDSGQRHSDLAGLSYEAATPPSVLESPDVNAAFIAAEQNHQLGDLTEADILFYNTFNQVQSNGDEYNLSSPDTFNESPREVAAPPKFNPFATIPSLDVDSPVYEISEPFPAPTNMIDQSEDLVEIMADEPQEDTNLEDNNSSISSVVVGVANSMDVVLTETSDVVVLTPTSPVSTQSPVPEEDKRSHAALDIVIPEIGVTPPEPGTEYDEDEYYRELEASREVHEAVQQEHEVIELDPDVVEQDTEVIQTVQEMIVQEPEAIRDDLEVSLSESEQAGEEAKEDFDSWTKVSEVDFDRSDETQVVVEDEDSVIEISQSSTEEVVGDSSQAGETNEHDDVCINSRGSDSETSEALSSSTEKKSTKKKKSEVTETTTTTKTKRNKKTKKEEKENISVIETATNNMLTPSPTPLANEILLEDARDLSNVSVKELEVLGMPAVSRINAVAPAISKASKIAKSLPPAKKSDPKQVEVPTKPPPPVITHMTLKTSFPSLTPLEVTRTDAAAAGDFSTGRAVSWKARSMGDLTICHNAEANAKLDEERPPINTGVSVLTLAASYCNLVPVSDKTPVVTHKRCVYTPPPKKSSFSKFDALSKKTVLHVRSGDASKAQKQFSQASSGEVSCNCKACGKQVFQMEQVKAERCVWHKNCFRCKECNKQLTVDIYSSHEGVVYCKPHFKDLFKPKAVIEDDTPGSDKPDLGLEELSSLNVKSRFQAFENKNEEENTTERSLSAVNVKRSPSILSKLARFQSKGMDIGVTDDSLNGVPLNDSSSSEEEEEEGEGEREVVRANRKHRERPVSFSKMEDIKGRWETGTALSREERREERKQEISTIRSRLFMGHQGKMKEAYQQAVSESSAATVAPGKKETIEVGSDRARSIKERFERGDVANTDADDEQKRMIDEDLVDAGYTKKSRSLFLEMDATAAKCTAPASPMKPGVVRDESFRRPREGKSPEREIYRDPTIVRADDRLEEQEVMRSQTASKMLSFFKNMEVSATKEDLPAGPKPLKRFTPPPDCELGRDTGSSEEEDEESEEEEEDEEHNPDIIRSSDKVEDEFLKQSQSAIHAKALRAKFERWEEKEVERERAHVLNNGSGPLDQVDQTSDQTSLDTTRSLRARFESMNNEQAANKDKVARPKVNRFV